MGADGPYFNLGRVDVPSYILSVWLVGIRREAFVSMLEACS